MFFSVCALGREKGQVLDSVVVSYAVDVVDFFGRQKEPAQAGLHHYPVFEDFIANSCGMTRSVDADISVAHSPTVPEVPVFLSPLRFRDFRLGF
jgi:hypothetical protein